MQIIVSVCVLNEKEPSSLSAYTKRKRGRLSIIWKYDLYDKIKRDFF